MELSSINVGYECSEVLILGVAFLLVGLGSLGLGVFLASHNKLAVRGISAAMGILMGCSLIAAVNYVHAANSSTAITKGFRANYGIVLSPQEASCALGALEGKACALTRIKGGKKVTLNLQVVGNKLVVFEGVRPIPTM